MQIDIDTRVEVLQASLKYIKEFHDKIIVIKYGGHAMQSDALKLSVVKGIVLLKYVGMKPIVVHGGGPEITELMELKGLKAEFKNGLRVTDEETMKITEMVLSGSISPQLAALFNANDVKSLSFSGKDDKLMRAKVKDESLGLVGEITDIDTNMILNLIEQDYVPIISPICYGQGGISLNVNSDEAAKELAIALGAEKLILITDVDGVLKDVNDKSSVLNRLTLSDVNKAKDMGIISGGMIPKIDACVSAIEGGVNKAHIINGMTLHSLLVELFTNEGIGTMITSDDQVKGGTYGCI